MSSEITMAVLATAMLASTIASWCDFSPTGTPRVTIE
jgi:hypothetical protein